jgi:hypothetical protein
MMTEDDQDLPHIEFDTEIKTNEIDLDEDFDVFKAANGQRRRRSSIMSYTGNRNNLEPTINETLIIENESEDVITKEGKKILYLYN